MKVKGSYTVEASVLMPLILFVVLLAGTYAFYLHDEAGALANAQVMNEQRRIEEISHVEGQVSYMDANTGLMMAQNASFALQGKTAYLETRVTAGWESAFVYLFQNYGFNVPSGVDQTDQDLFVDPCKCIRTYRMLQNLKKAVK